MKEFNGIHVTIMSCSNCNTKCKYYYVSYKENFVEKDLYKNGRVFLNKEVIYNQQYCLASGCYNK